MRAFYGCEVTYPFVPQHVLDAADSVRASLPNKYCDPKVAADLFHETLDEYLVADDVGLNVMATEHHAGINSLIGSNPTFIGAIARQTRKARILSLGTLISLRKDPVRIAEEYAMIDVISRGRLEIGLVKSGGSEMASNNGNPMQNEDRMWEGDRSHLQGADPSRGPIQLGGQALHASPCEYLAGPLSAADAQAVGGDRRSALDGRVRAPRHHQHACVARARGYQEGLGFLQAGEARGGLADGHARHVRLHGYGLCRRNR